MKSLTSNYDQTVLILAGIFLFSLSLYLEMKMLNSLSHILVLWVFHSFSLVLVNEISLHFCQLLVFTFSQTAVTNI